MVLRGAPALFLSQLVVPCGLVVGSKDRKNTRADEPCGPSAPATSSLWRSCCLGQGAARRKSALGARFFRPVASLTFDRNPTIVRQSFRFSTHISEGVLNDGSATVRSSAGPVGAACARVQRPGGEWACELPRRLSRRRRAHRTVPLRRRDGRERQSGCNYVADRLWPAAVPGRIQPAGDGVVVEDDRDRRRV